MKNLSKKFKRPNLRSLIMTVLTFAVAVSLYMMPCIAVQAEESYSCEIGYNCENYVKSTDTLTNSENYMTYYSSVPLKVYAFSYETSGSAGGSNRVGTSLTYYTCPADFSKTAPAIWYYDPDGTQHTVNIGNAGGVPCYASNGGIIYTEYIDGGYKGNYTSCDWNISYMELPEGMTCEDALLGIYNGTLNYITQDSPENLKTLDSDFYFIGFKGDNYVNASWQDVSDRTYMLDIDPEYYVSAGFGYASPDSTEVTQKIWLEDDFDYNPMKLSYDIAEHKNKYDDMYLRAVYVVPSYRSSGAGWWHGQPSTIYLKEDGSLEKVANNEKPIISIVSENGVYDSAIPVPRIVTTDIAYECYFSNASDNYYIEIQGRCYTVDDIELYKENAMWKYKYSTVLKNNLASWVSPTDMKNSRGGHNLGDYAKESFSKLLKIYPIENRSYYGGKNSLSNYLFGYDDALTMLKDTLLPNITSAYNGLEIYARYFTIEEDGSYKYGKWCHWFDNLASIDGSSGSILDDMNNVYGENQSQGGLTDSEKDNLESSSDSKNGDKDVVSSIVNNSSSLDTTQLFSTLSELFSNLGQLPQLTTAIFGFLPDWLIGLIAVSIGLLVVIGVAKAVL